MVIHLIINFDMLPGRKGCGMAYGLRYRGFLAGLFAYYVVDAGWGVFAGLGWTHALYVDSMLYYLVIAVSVLMWCRYVIAYLNFGNWKSQVLFWFGYALLVVYVVLLVVNVFNNCLFHFDERGAYVPGSMRSILFCPLVVLNVLMAGFALVTALGNRDAVRRRNLVVFMFCLTMAVAIAFQIAWPLWPYYALGCLIGNCFFHVFVVEDERAELRQAVVEREQAMKHAAELEKALARARAAEKARSMFFSIVSHDIRTPLNSIICFSEMLQHGFETKAEQDLAVNSILVSSKMLLQLVNDILDLSKLESGKMNIEPEPTDVARLVREIAASFGATHQKPELEILCRVGGTPALLLDSHRLRQIAFNLMGNAIKFTKKGYIEIRTSFAPDADGKTGVFRLEVEDTGCGISEADLKKLARPFVQVGVVSGKRAGTGLGLHICRMLARAMGGEMEIKSALGKGTTISIVVPGVRAVEGEGAGAGDAAKGDASTSDVSSLHVLIADDTKMTQIVLRAMFKRLGVKDMDFADNGREALELLTAPDAPKFDFVLTDAWMPEMTGMELVAAIRANPSLAKLPVYLFTAEVEMKDTYAEKGFNGILLKPANLDALRKLLP